VGDAEAAAAVGDNVRPLADFRAALPTIDDPTLRQTLATMVDGLDRKLAQRRYAEICAAMQTLGKVVKAVRSESESVAEMLLEGLAGLDFVCAVQ
jgi:hypothetical protein